MRYDSFKITYHSGGFGPIEMFYTETLTIKEDGITYKKEWEANKGHKKKDLLIEDVPYRSSLEPDFSWKIKFNISDDYERLAEQLRRAEFELDDKAFACDGDTTIVELVDVIDGKKLTRKSSFSLCCNDRFRRTIRLLLSEYIKEGLMPDFLKDYEEYEDEEESK